MSDSEDSTVTYTAVSSPLGGLLNIRYLGVDGPPVMPEDPYAYVVAAFQAPPSPDYVPGPEEPEQAPLSREFVPKPVFLEFMPLEDEVFPAEEQPLPAAVSPTTDSLEYITDSDPEEDEEDPEEDPKEDPTDYPADGGDDDDDESFDDDEDDDDDVEEDEDEEEEEHPALADYPEAEIARLLAIPSPPPSPLSPWSSPLPQIPSPPLPRAESPSTSHSLLLPPPIILSHTRASVAMMRAAAPSTYILASRSERPPSGTPPLLPIPLPTPSPPLLLPSTDGRANTPETSRGFRADYGFVATLDDEIRRDPERDVGYGITDTWDEMLDTDEIYGRLNEVQDARAVLSGRPNLLQRDRCSHAYTALLMEREARLSCEAWGWSMDASDTARSKVRALRTTVLAHQTEIAALRAADRARQAQLVETLRLMSTLQTQVTTLQGQ
ncbi:hypothetical protein Tco_1561801 [Tanacetum coccineum]